MTANDWEECRKRLFQILRDRSFERRKVLLSSGKESDYYIDCRQTTLHPEGISLIASLIYNKIKGWDPPVQAIGGPTLGADPIVTAVSLKSLEERAPIPGFLVRKRAKVHGMRRRIEGIKNIERGSSVCVVEDVLTTGGSCLNAVEVVEEEGFRVGGIVALVDRGEGALERIRSRGYRVEVFYRASEFF